MRGKPDSKLACRLGTAAVALRPAPLTGFAKKEGDIIIAEADGELVGCHPGVCFEVKTGACLNEHDGDSKMIVPHGVVQGSIAVVGALSVDIERQTPVAMLHQKPRNIGMPHIPRLMSSGGAHQPVQSRNIRPGLQQGVNDLGMTIPRGKAKRGVVVVQRAQHGRAFVNAGAVCNQASDLVDIVGFDPRDQRLGGGVGAGPLLGRFHQPSDPAEAVSVSQV